MDVEEIYFVRVYMLRASRMSDMDNDCECRLSFP